jgi:UDP-N-acetylglucosamine 2-epimerase
VVDLPVVLPQLYAQQPALLRLLSAVSPGRRTILVTAHRRENFGEPLARICGALREMAQRCRDSVHIV